MTEKHFCLDDSPSFQMIELDCVTSTNDFLRSYHPVVAKRMTLVTAEFQTAGRGAGNNHWESAKGENLMFSLLTHPTHLAASEVFVLSEIMALALSQALNDFLPETANDDDRHKFTIKWPNDIYYGDRKICGLLIENELMGRQVKDCVMGVGVNINQLEFVSDAPNPCSLAHILGHPVERRFVLERVMQYFTQLYELTEQGHSAFGDIHQRYLANLYRKGETHTYRDKDGEFVAVLSEVEPSGHLVLIDEEGRKRRYAFKEVQWSPFPHSQIPQS